VAVKNINDRKVIFMEKIKK